MLLFACGWRFGEAPLDALSVGPVEGVTLQPGLRADLHDALLRAARRRGVRPGERVVRTRIVEATDRPRAATPGAGAVQWTAHLAVRGTMDGRPGCRVEVAGRRGWALPPSAPEGVDARRAAAWRRLADDVADRLLDDLAATPECR